MTQSKVKQSRGKTTNQQIKHSGLPHVLEKGQSLVMKESTKRIWSRERVWFLSTVLYHDMSNGQHTKPYVENKKEGADCKHMSVFIS